MNNRAIDENWLIGLVIAYVILIIAGAIGNGLVCIAVARKPAMRTERNMLILNLAISDLFLCFFTIPFSLVEIAVRFWPLGVITCKLVAGLEATSIFVSTISITAIALDRYKVILYPNKQTCSPSQMLFKLISIWATALILSSPLLLFRHLKHLEFPNIPQLKYVDYCIEMWPMKHGRGYYSVFVMIFQYFFPIIILSVAYARVCQKIKSRVARRKKMNQNVEKSKQIAKRTHRTNILLISIAVIFGISWLPLNILNLVADFFYPHLPFDSNLFRITFAICHMIGMSSACSNPFLYGWLNTNFRNEFKELFDLFKLMVSKCEFSPTSGATSRTTVMESTLIEGGKLSHKKLKDLKGDLNDFDNLALKESTDKNKIDNSCGDLQLNCNSTVHIV